MKTQDKQARKQARKRRIRAKIMGTAARPRFSVSRSNTRTVLQLINDEKGETLAMAISSKQKGTTEKDRMIAAAQDIAAQAKAKKITKVVFDRGGLTYTGNIVALADAAREAGLIF